MNPPRETTHDDIILANKALTRAEGDFAEAAEMLGWPVAKLRAIVRHYPELKSKWCFLSH